MKMVAEIGSNHNASFARAVHLIEAAKGCGFTDVKLQMFQLEDVFSPEAIRLKPELRERRRLGVPHDWHEDLILTSRELGMGYGLTVFRKDLVETASAVADWIKVSSYSILDLKLLEVVGKQKKPVVVSTGMATIEECSAAVKAVGNEVDLTLLHCVSHYPALPHEANLRSMEALRAKFGCPVGWSDHTRSRLVVGRAGGLYRADMLELHFDMDDRAGAETAHSWTPKMLSGMSWSHTDPGYYSCDGKAGVKGPAMSEWEERGWRADPKDGLRPLEHVRHQLR